MLQNLINSLDREQLLMCLTDPSVDDSVLRSAVLHCATTNGASNGASNGAAKPAPAVVPLGAVKVKPRAKAPAAPKTPGAPKPADNVVATLLGAGVGFAVADVIATGVAMSLVVSRSQATSAIKRAVAAGVCHGAGSRRFTRYAGTLALATAASTAARG